MKRALLICLLILAAVTTVSGTVAFFTDNVTAQSQVESGELSILQHEYERVRDASGGYTATLRPYTQQQVIYPSVVSTPAHNHTVTVDGHSVQLLDSGVSNYVDKIVVAENIGKLQAYVRTFVAVPAYHQGETHVSWVHLDKNTAGGWTWCAQPVENVSIDGVTYDIYYATNTNQLAPGASTAPSLLGFYVDPHLSQDDSGYIYRAEGGAIALGPDAAMTILVATEASQAIVFDSAAQAMDETYGTPSANRHPWANVVVAASQAELTAALTDAAYNTRIALKDGAYTLPAQLPAGVRIFALGLNVTLTAEGGAFSAYDVEIDGVTFTAPVTITGHGSLQEVTFRQGFTAGATTGDMLFDRCVFDTHTVSAGSYNVVITDCVTTAGAPITQ